MKSLGIVFAATLLMSALPAFAQGYGYHQSYGTSRVTYMDQVGLSHPSATYIGDGTLSQSAQGKPAGVGGALPECNMGSHVRKPGDNLYDNDGTQRMGNGALVYDDQIAAMKTRAMAKAKFIRQHEEALERQAQMEDDQKQQGYMYIPGSNGAAASYNGSSGVPMTYTPSGAATYGGYIGQPSTRF